MLPLSSTYPRLATSSALFAFCSTSITVVPWELISRTMLKIVSWRIGARPSDGSSSMSTFGRAISARPIASICCSPPDSVPAICVRRSRRRGKSLKTRSISDAIPGLSFREYAPMNRLSTTVMRGKRRRPSGDWQMPSSTIFDGPVWVMSWPSNVTVPACGCISPEMVRSVVVLPAPFDPMSATTSPFSTLIVTPRSAWILP